MQACIKGNQFLLVKAHITTVFGNDAFNNVLEQMPQHCAASFKKMINSSSWVPEEAFVELLATADKVLGKGDYKLCEELGSILAKVGIPKFYKIFIQFGNPSFVIQRAPRFWKQLHNTGRLEVIATAKTSVIGRLVDKSHPHKAFCASLIGYFKATLELCGATNISVEELECVCNGNSCCEFAASWK
ncbi:MAG: hypothetical protein GY858_06395 [Candidatus Omnitrophica bacterium]|nr:hypothetical protein [Candidatus Omnitrophota bacterium]